MSAAQVPQPAAPKAPADASGRARRRYTKRADLNTMEMAEDEKSRLVEVILKHRDKKGEGASFHGLNWKEIAAEHGHGRSETDCKDMWNGRLRQLYHKKHGRCDAWRRKDLDALNMGPEERDQLFEIIGRHRNLTHKHQFRGMPWDTIAKEHGHGRSDKDLKLLWDRRLRQLWHKQRKRETQTLGQADAVSAGLVQTLNQVPPAGMGKQYGMGSKEKEDAINRAAAQAVAEAQAAAGTAQAPAANKDGPEISPAVMQAARERMAYLQQHGHAQPAAPVPGQYVAPAPATDPASTAAAAIAAAAAAAAAGKKRPADGAIDGAAKRMHEGSQPTAV